MGEIFDKKYIFLDQDLKSKEDVFDFLSNKVVEMGLADDEQAVVDAFKDRESQASTGMQNGIAIPHALTSSVNKPAVLYIKLKDSIDDWKTFDDTKVNKVIAMLVPENGEQEHLKILAKFAESLVDDEVINKLDNAKSVKEVYEILSV